MTLGMSQFVGIDLQQVSIAALIIALGLLVDAPVVAADAINRELAHGQPRHVAAWLGPKRLARAVFYATLTNIVAFLPLLLVKGKTGDFIYSLPIVVSLSLVAAMLVAWTFAPAAGLLHAQGAEGVRGAPTASRRSGFPRLYKAFVEMLHRAPLPHDRGLAVLILAAGARSAVRTIGTSFFPKDLHNVFVVNLDLPEGSPIRADPRRGAWTRSARSTPWRASASAATRRSSAPAGRGSGSRSNPSSAPTTTPRSWCTRPTSTRPPRSSTG